MLIQSNITEPSDNLDQRIGALSQQKRALLALKLKQRGREFNSFPLSFAQQRLWFLHQFDVNDLYNISQAIRLKGSLNVSALARTFSEVERRHEVLRTSFLTVDGEPVQRINDWRPVQLPVVDLGTLTAKEKEVTRIAAYEAQRAFDLTDRSLVRLSLLRLAEDEHVVLITMHHIVSDGWSLAVMIDEIAQLYLAFTAGRPSPLSEVPIQYADYAVWQRQWLANGVMDEQLRYWKEMLRGVPPVLELPTDRARPAVKSFRGASLSFVLSEQVSEALRQLSRREGSTLFMTLLAVFQILLYRYTGQNDIVVGSPIAGRNRVETERLIGLFVNTLALRTRINSESSFIDLLAHVKEITLGAYAHQDLPFEKLVDELQPERSLSHGPIFQVMFQVHNFTQHEDHAFSGLSLTSLGGESSRAKFDLTLSVIDHQQLRLSFEYDTDLFEASTIVRMTKHFRNLVESVLAHPDLPVSELSLLESEEEKQLVTGWNETALAYARELTLDEMIAAQSKRTPEAVAVVHEGRGVTYRQLDEAASRFAHQLQRIGVGPEMRVGICLERSIEMVVALLGTLKAGGAYVPLDPAYPPGRLQFMCEDAGLEALVVDAHERAQTFGSGLPVLTLADWTEIPLDQSGNQGVRPRPENLAYVMYTSGSTGTPKGVMVTHRNLVNFLTAMQQRWSLGENDRLLAITTLSFDIAGLELYLPLCSGAQVMLVNREVVMDGRRLAELIDQGVTMMQATPASWRLLLEAGWQGAPRLQMLCGGEALSTTLATELAPRVAELSNMYGPTETTIWSAMHDVKAAGRITKIEDQPLDATVSIGRPIANTQLYVLDRRQQLVGVGIRGELYIGGEGVARGYLRRPDLTAERFIPDQFGDTAGARLYRTGDLVRRLPDGRLEYLGRLDDQVKVRGFRIELGEIESALKKEPRVAEAVAVIRDDDRGEKRIIGYVLVKEGSQVPATAELRRHMLALLPDYMIPATFVQLKEVPLTPSGKIDRRRLPAPAAAGLVLEHSYEGPRTTTEELLCKIWSEVLRVKRVGIRDNFFELGGDSVLSIQVISRANAAGLSLTTRQMFQYQNIAELAELVPPSLADVTEQGLVSGDVPLTPPQQSYFERQPTNPHLWSRVLYLDVDRPVNSRLLDQAVQQLVMHHDALRMRFTHTAQGWRQVNKLLNECSSVVHLDLTSTTVDRNLTVERVALAVQKSLDLSDGPLMRVAFLDFGAETSGCLLIVIHHLLVDDISSQILFEDLVSSYQQLEREQATSLPPKTTSYRYWAHRLSEYAQEHTGSAELAHWTGAERESIATLPCDYPDGLNNVASAQTIFIDLTAAETTRLVVDAAAVYKTNIEEMLLSSLAGALSRWGDRARLLVAVDHPGREAFSPNLDVSRTIGSFAFLAPLVLTVENPVDSVATLKRVKEQLRAVPQNGFSYGLCRYFGNPEARRKLQAAPAAEVSFRYRGQTDDVARSSSAFRIVKEETGPSAETGALRAYVLEVSAKMSNGQLLIALTYSEHLHERASIEALAQALREALLALVTESSTAGWQGYTPSDFPEAKLDQKELDNFLAKVRRSSQRKGQ